MNKNEKGFGLVEIILMVVAIVLLSFAGYYSWNKINNKSENQKSNAADNGVGQVCYDGGKSQTPVQCYDLATSKTVQIKNSQLPDVDGMKYLVPSPDGSKYLVIVEAYDTTIPEAKDMKVSYFLADAKLQNLQSIKNLEKSMVFFYDAAWKSDSSGFYYTGFDPNVVVDHDEISTAQIFYFDISKQTATKLTNNPAENIGYSNPILGNDEKTLIFVDNSLPDSNKDNYFDQNLVSINVDGTGKKVLGLLPPGITRDYIYYDRTSDSVILPGDADHGSLSISFSDALKGDITGKKISITSDGSIKGVTNNTYVLNHFENETYTGFDLLNKKTNVNSNVNFTNNKGNLLFIFSGSSLPLAQ